MVELKSVAVSIKEIREPGAAGYPNSVMMVPYKLAQDRLDERDISHKLVLEENDKLCKEVEKLRNENWRLRKNQEQPHIPHIGGPCRC